MDEPVELGVMQEATEVRCYPTHHDFVESTESRRDLPVLYCRLCGTIVSAPESDEGLEA
jgi:hypothetical protein